MPIYFKTKLLFVHIPKTAGMSVETMLNFFENGTTRSVSFPNLASGIKNYNYNRSYMHLRYLDLIDYCKTKNINIDDYKIFSIVRNPFDRAVSDFYCCNSEFEKKPITEKNIDVLRNTFDEFLDKYFTSGLKYDNHSDPQHIYLIDNDSNLIPNIIIMRFENLDNDFKQLNLGDLSKHVNKSNNKINNYKDYYNESSKQKVIDFYKKDFEMFDYSTEL